LPPQFRGAGLNTDLPSCEAPRDRREVRFVIVLDTNVLSALMRTTPDAVVVEWLDRQPADSIWVTSITAFEARFGLALLPKGKRRSRLERAFDRVVTEDLSRRVLSLDEMATVTAGQLAAERQRSGRVVDLRDTLTAGIAQAWRATIATRNTRDFEGLNVPVVDPCRTRPCGVARADTSQDGERSSLGITLRAASQVRSGAEQQRRPEKSARPRRQ
jgi:predicted nucleic acid-binding protein